mmetsp:Transcript_154818/g.475702  ORF Transcript_154818/g.475702 Transcript_154818/m.475702 type:complete len:96 (+) Transcript_154818:243-530(+)
MIEHCELSTRPLQMSMPPCTADSQFRTLCKHRAIQYASVQGEVAQIACILAKADAATTAHLQAEHPSHADVSATLHWPHSATLCENIETAPQKLN